MKTQNMKAQNLTPVRVFVTVLFTTVVPALAQVPDITVQAGALQGYSVAVDGNVAVVGAVLDDACALDSGVAKVYDATTGALLHTLVNPSPASNDRFGNSVAISGTLVVVGAPGDDTGAADAGSAYVYDLASATPTVPVAVLNNPSPGEGDAFGYAVAVSGTQVVVGAPFDDAMAVDDGTVYVYDLASAMPTMPVATLINPDPAAELTDPSSASSDWFGYSVAISGTKIVVGAPGDSTIPVPLLSAAGSAYVYDLASLTPTEPVATLFNPTPAANDYFGWSVAVSRARAVVGAPLDDIGATDGGTAYVYDLAVTTPILPPFLILTNRYPEFRDNFGYSVSISGVAVVVGVPLDNAGAIDAGLAYLYDSGDRFSPNIPVAILYNPTLAVDDRFGYSVAISSTRVLVGAPYDDTRALDAGSAYVYQYSLDRNMPPVLLATLNEP